ncbi:MULTISPECIES: S8 family serine peptidase [Exiguobacterium]|uniref:S8 family serine peptidase n=1 Tax=Exiguobacterium TaxID=33986 RepID=UPI00073659E9|nr:S8 family serine peptidase [Exiguobacterium chiriqhucha]
MATYFLKLILVTGTALLTFGSSVSATENEAMPERVIVEVKGTRTGDFEGEVISSNQLRKQATMTMEVPEGMATSAFIKELEQDVNVLRVEEDHLLKSTYTPSDRYFNYQSHHTNIQSEDAWDRAKGENIVVAILDDGIDLRHEDFKGKIVNPYDIVYDSPYTLTPGEHGTHVAGIVASQMDNDYGGVGVAPNAFIMPIDVFVGDAAYTSDTIKAIYRAVDQGANVINMSLGSYNYSYAYQQAINYAYEKNVVVVAAAGNDATSATHYPSSYNHVISVGSTTSYDTLSYFSNYGWDIDITAPGSSIFSTMPYNKYAYMSGTSMASPVVAGVVALLKSSEPNLSVDAITERLTSTADDLGNAGWDYYYGHGRVNAKAALRVRKLEAVTVYEFSDISETITGMVPTENGIGHVSITDESGNVVGSARNLSGGEYFSITMPRYEAGTKLKVVFHDDIGNYSPSTLITVSDRTNPIVTGIKNKQLTNKSILIQYNEGTATLNGKRISNNWSVQTSGDYTLRVTDQAGNTTVLTFTIDKVAPSKPTISTLTNKSTNVTGKAEKGSTVSITYNGRTYTTKASTFGTYRYSLKTTKAGASVMVRAKDTVGNVSTTASNKVLNTFSTFTVNTIKSSASSVTGKGNKSATVKAYVGSKAISKAAKADSKGNYKLTIPRQKAGVTVTVKMTQTGYQELKKTTKVAK